MNDINYWHLRNHVLCKGLDQHELENLAKISTMKSFNRDDIIYFNESAAKKCFIIIIGTIKICRSDNENKEIISELLTADDVFGHYSSSENIEQYGKIISDEARLCSIDFEKFRTLLQSNHQLLLNYNDAIREKMLSFKQKYEDLIFKDVDTRVNDFFIRYGKFHGKLVAGKIEIPMMLTHQEIADYTATSRQSVTTIINRMVEKGIIVYEGRKKVIIQ